MMQTDYKFPITLQGRKSIMQTLSLITRRTSSFSVLALLLLLALFKFHVMVVFFPNLFYYYLFAYIIMIIGLVLWEFKRKLTLTDTKIIYNKLVGTFSCDYKNIEKVGYFTRSKYTQWVTRHSEFSIQIFLTNDPSPNNINITLFSEKDVMLFLNVLKYEAPQALFGDNILSIMNSGTYPEKDPPFIVFLTTTIKDTNFTHLNVKNENTDNPTAIIN